MNCNLCGNQEATIHLTEIVNDQMIEIHLCETCAQEKGTSFKTHFNFGDFLSGFADAEKPKTKGERAQVQKCSGCGLTYDEFGKSGRLGCSECYKSFAKLMIPLIKRVQQSTHHVGKKPNKIDRRVRASHDLRLMQDRLRKSIENEAFEEAAKLRDEIKKVEDRLKKGKKPKS